MDPLQNVWQTKCCIYSKRYITKVEAGTRTGTHFANPCSDLDLQIIFLVTKHDFTIENNVLRRMTGKDGQEKTECCITSFVMRMTVFWDVAPFYVCL
jgi:hypothetical protein